MVIQGFSWISYQSHDVGFYTSQRLKEDFPVNDSTERDAEQKEKALSVEMLLQKDQMLRTKAVSPDVQVNV